MKEQKNAVRHDKLKTRQRIAEALLTAHDLSNYYQTVDENNLRKTIANFVEIQKLSPTELENDLCEALCDLAKISKELEIYKEAVEKIQIATNEEKIKPKGGRPINKWAIQAFNCAKNYQLKNRKMPSAEMLKRLVSAIAESDGQFGDPSSDGEFPMETAKQYLKYFKNNLPMFIALDADNWFDLYAGRFHWTKL